MPSGASYNVTDITVSMAKKVKLSSVGAQAVSSRTSRQRAMLFMDFDMKITVPYRG